QLVQSCYLKFGLEKTVDMLDSLKTLGFTYATKSGLSIGIDDLIIPKEKAGLVAAARQEVIKVESQYLEGAITNGERYNKVIAIWSQATEDTANAMFSGMEEMDKEGRQFNPVHHGRLRCPRIQTADPSARRHARPDGEAVRRNHRVADCRPLPRRSHRHGVL